MKLLNNIFPESEHRNKSILMKEEKNSFKDKANIWNLVNIFLFERFNLKILKIIKWLRQIKI